MLCLINAKDISFFKKQHRIQCSWYCCGTELSNTAKTAHLRHVHEAGPRCGNQAQGLNGAVHQLGENVTRCLCGFCAAVNLINMCVREFGPYIMI